jgi:hypothetical protein
MKVVSVVEARAFRIFRPFGSFGYLPDAVKKVVEEFKFLDYPKEIAQLFPAEDTNEPIVFRHGKLIFDGREIVVDFLQIYRAGLQVVTVTNTSDALTAVDQIAQWGIRAFDLKLETVKDPGFYSQLQVRFEKPLPEMFPKLKTIAGEIGDKHPDIMDFRPKYELTALHFSYAPKNKTDPVIFRIERAGNVSFSENLFYSDAALTTEEHIKVLEDFERVNLSD